MSDPWRDVPEYPLFVVDRVMQTRAYSRSARTSPPRSRNDGPALPHEGAAGTSQHRPRSGGAA